MKITPAPLTGAYVVESTPFRDDRGFFYRLYCQETLSQAGLNTAFIQINHSRTTQAGVIRGLHYQIAPHTETKLIRCVRGAVFDVMVDVRQGSPTFLSWFGVELTEDNYRLSYVPAGFAHGIQALQPDAEIVYLSSAIYAPQAERGVRFDDPRIGIDWPLPPIGLSAKDYAIETLSHNFQGVQL